MKDIPLLIQTELKKILKVDEITLEIPPDTTLGDYALACYPFAKILKKNPNMIAQNIATQFKLKSPLKKIEVVGAYVNFFVNPTLLAEDILTQIAKEKDKFGIKKSTKKKILIEFPGPNTNKPLHLGHVRNMVLGTALGNIMRANGYQVIPVNINNDRGIHICKSMLAYQKWGKDDTPEKSQLKSDFFVGKYYVMFQQKLKSNPDLEHEAKALLEKWEKGDKETLALWKKMNTWAYDGFKTTYKRFGIAFKKEYYESETYNEGRKIVLDGLKKGLFVKDNDKSIYVDLEKEGFGKKILLRSNGTTVYITQDMYLAKAKYDDFSYDKSFYVVATEQNYHFKVLFEILKILKFPFADRCFHFAYGMVNLTTGKMKSREGTVVDADTLMDNVEALAQKETKKRSKLSEKEVKKRGEKIAMAAVRFYLAKYEPVKDITFNPKESISFEGETGPYIQYACARISSILRKLDEMPGKGNVKLLVAPQEVTLIKMLSSYPDILIGAGEHMKPSLLCRYLLDLAQHFNEFYHVCPVLEEDEQIRDARLLLITCVQQVLKNGLALLSIEALPEM